MYTPTNKPRKLSDLLSSGFSKAKSATAAGFKALAQSSKPGAKNYTDTAVFRNSLKEGKNGNWYTQQGEAFVDGTYDPKTGKRQSSHVIKKTKY